MEPEEKEKSLYDPAKEVKFAAPKAAKASFSWANMRVEDLLAYRAQIDAHLPASKLKDLDLETELVVQFLTTKTLQEQVLADETVPANQRAQVANSVASALQSLVKMQEEVHSAERMKKLERLLIATLREWPEDQVEAFFKRYEEVLAGEGAQ